MKSYAQGLGKDARRLREFTAFDKFSDDELERLVRAAHHSSQSVPWPLIREQTPSDACYISCSAGRSGCTSARTALPCWGQAR